MEVGDLQFLGVLSGGLLSGLIGLPSGSGQLLGLVNGDDIGEELLGTNSALGIGSLHDLHLGTAYPASPARGARPRRRIPCRRNPS